MSAILSQPQYIKHSWSERLPKMASSQLTPGDHFTNNVSILIIQIHLKFHFLLYQFLAIGSLWNFAHDMIAVLLWHVQKFVVIW